MKYEKALADVVAFTEWEVHMIISRGKVCQDYGTIDQGNDVMYSCFVFYLGTPRPALDDYLSRCDDVTSPGGICSEISCKYVTQLYGKIVT